MPRPLRINYPHACYHVMNRGAGRRKIFRNNIHRYIFLELLQECHKMFNVKIYSYCLMDNHYHLLLSTPNANLPRMMRHLNGTYTQKYNRMMGTDGPLFRGRYKAQLIEEDSYRLIVSRYIHLNPVKASIVNNPLDYKWSSYPAYLNKVKTPNWLAKSSIINQLFSTKSLSHIEDYKAYVESMVNDDGLISSKYTIPILGSESFKEKILSHIDKSTIEASAHDYKRAKTAPTIKLIIDSVCKYFQIKQELLIQSRRKKLNLPKLIYIYISRKHYGHTLRMIAEPLEHKCTSTISSAVSKFHLYLQNNPELFREIDSICKIIKNVILTGNQ